MDKNKKKSLELYIHIPFCERKCLYCDFLSFRGGRDVQAEYMDQLRCEIGASGPWYSEYRVDTIFIGGGTPAVLEPEQITLLMQAVRRAFTVAEDAEITIEANPGTLLGKKLPIYRAAGINRLSLGVQSASDEELKLLGRIHIYEDFLKAFQNARMAGFTNINVDLMSGIPGQTLSSWRNTLRKIIMLKPEHISAYSLIVEEGTPFGDHYGFGDPRKKTRGDLAGTPARPSAEPEDWSEGPEEWPDILGGWPPLVDEETDRQMYHLTKSLLEEAGYERYEISNHAKRGLHCRHNVGYWTGVEYLGFGIGAASFVDGCRFCNEADIAVYQELDLSLDGLDRLHGDIHVLSRREQMEEFMFLGLRMTKGVSNAAFVEAFGVHMDTVYGEVIQKLVEKGLLTQRGRDIALTEWGMDVSNRVFSEFLLDG